MKKGKWKQTEYAKMRGLMKQGDKIFKGVRGDTFWDWVSDRMGRSAAACRSKDVHMRAAHNGVVEHRKKKPKPSKPDVVLAALKRLRDALDEVLELLG